MRASNIWANIRQLRLQAGMTQVEFASRVGVTNITVSKWENERQTPSLKCMAELERVLGANPWRSGCSRCPVPLARVMEGPDRGDGGHDRGRNVA